MTNNADSEDYPRHERILLRDHWCLIAILVLAVNDHWLKHSSYAGVVSGKISDFAGVYYFPFLLTDICWMIGLRSLAKWRVMQLASVITALIMLGLKLSPAVRLLYLKSLGILGIHAHVVDDATDLVSLVMLPLALKRFCTLTGVTCSRMPD